MVLYLIIGPSPATAEAFAQVLTSEREHLARHGVLTPTWNATRLALACVAPEKPLWGRWAEAREEATRARLQDDIAALAAEEARAVLLNASAFAGALATETERRALKELLAPLGPEIRIVAHIDEQARMLARFYQRQLEDGRRSTLDRELTTDPARPWWDAAQDRAPDMPFWLDFARLLSGWETTFGAGTVTLRPVPPDPATELGMLLGLPDLAPHPMTAAPAPSAASLTRMRQMNDILALYAEKGGPTCPPDMRAAIHQEIAIDGPPLAPGSLRAFSDRFAADNARLSERFPDLDAALRPDPATTPWQEASPEFGFRASQYLLAFRWRLDRTANTMPALKLTPIAEQILSPIAKEKFTQLAASPFAPHNLIGGVSEDQADAPYPAQPRAPLPPGQSGKVIVGCMKNEAPYIIEWVAYHRAIGVDNFLIYTNGCEDGTDEILQRLDAMGVLQHRDNNGWTGNSPQQYALNQSLDEPVIRNADWIIHIDVDEFINVRTGNGTLDDLIAACPGITNFAMTWRLFGHNAVTALDDRFVIDQFDHCAPSFCPKPHTVWGFKSMFRNMGAYQKISCHRPNKLSADMTEQVRWANGSGKDITHEVLQNGWRSSKSSIGYDLVQLNHYALRSAESFLVKRQRGRALHVDRSIGLNYWIRMDWSDHKDITIKRNLPRLQEEFDRLMEDSTLAALHHTGMAWHRAKADALHATPEFAELYAQALKIKLTPTERVAYALALDLES